MQKDVILFHHQLSEECRSHMTPVIQNFNKFLSLEMVRVRSHAFFFNRKEDESAAIGRPLRYSLSRLLENGWVIYEANIEMIWPKNNPEEYIKSFREIKAPQDVLQYNEIWIDDYDRCWSYASYDPYLPEYLGIAPPFKSEDEKWDYIWSLPAEDIDNALNNSSDNFYLEYIRGGRILKNLDLVF